MTIASPVQAYRTAGDLPDFEGTEQVRWQQPTTRYRLFDWVPANFQFAGVEQATREAFASWGEPECSQVSFSYQTQANASFDVWVDDLALIVGGGAF